MSVMVVRTSLVVLAAAGAFLRVHSVCTSIHLRVVAKLSTALPIGYAPNCYVGSGWRIFLGRIPTGNCHERKQQSRLCRIGAGDGRRTHPHKRNYCDVATDARANDGRVIPQLGFGVYLVPQQQHFPPSAKPSPSDIAPSIPPKSMTPKKASEKQSGLQRCRAANSLLPQRCGIRDRGYDETMRAFDQACNVWGLNISIYT
jgi:hypothetical protein